MKNTIPKSGLRDIALREAVTEYRAIIQAVRAALEQVICTGAPGVPSWVDLEAIYPDAVVVKVNGKFWQYPYTLAEDGAVTLGQAVQVVETYVPAASVPANARVETEGGDGGAMIEAVNADGQPAGTVWKVWAIRAGLSLNGVDYPPAVLREAAPLFEGVRVFEKSDEEHIKGQGKATRNLIGQLQNAAYVEASGASAGGIQADLHLLASSGLPPKLLEMQQRGMLGLVGFSIDASGKGVTKGGFREAVSILKVKSLDLIVEPGAGGRIINLIESEGAADMALREKMIEAVKAKHGGSLPANLNTADDDALETAYREAVSQNNTVTTTAGSGSGAGAHAPDVLAVQRRLDVLDMREAVASSGLPEAVKARLNAKIVKGTTLENLREAIVDFKEGLGALSATGHVVGLGQGRIEGGQDRSEKVKKMLDDFFDPKNTTLSFKECYVEITGDSRVTGQLRDCDRNRFREALGENYREALDSGSFSYVLGDSITRRMIADYNVQNNYDVWRQLSGDPVRINDFRTQERIRWGGYGDLPIVNESDPYLDVSSPTDEKATYGVKKRGGTEKITMEMIRNDDVGVIRGIPTKLSRASKRTLSKFVLDFIRTNPVIYDGKTLFHADHGNLGTAALATNSYYAARLAMMQQTEKDSGERLSIGARKLWVPDELENTAHDIFARGTNLDKTFVQTLNPDIIPVWYWTDANDWAVSADPLDSPTVEVGFLDGNQEPELFVQDTPNVGSLFSNDQIVYKIRHIYGAAVVDYRGLYKAIVP